MTYGIVKTDGGFAVKDFDKNEIAFGLGELKFPSYERAVEECCGKFYPQSYHLCLVTAGKLKKSGKLAKAPDADFWENLIYAGDYRGIWDGTRRSYKNVTSVDKGAATEEEIDYVDALASTYESLVAMAAK